MKIYAAVLINETTGNIDHAITRVGEILLDEEIPSVNGPDTYRVEKFEFYNNSPNQSNRGLVRAGELIESLERIAPNNAARVSPSIPTNLKNGIPTDKFFDFKKVDLFT